MELNMQPQIQNRINEWLSDNYDDETRNEIQKLIDSNDEEELIDRFYKDLEFGTGGLRGKIGAGTNRMNIYTVGKASQGMANYIIAQGMDAKDKGVVIAYDPRRFSKDFALTTALIMAGNGIRAYLFKELRPTPLLSYAVRKLKATAGIVITASHNPPDYNGYKAYWSNGGQVVPPIDKGIINEAKKITDIKQIKKLSKDEALDKKLLTIIEDEIDKQYLTYLKTLSINSDTNQKMGKDLKIVYTPLCGTGITLVPKALKDWGFDNVHFVEEQSKPDGNFPTLKHPNPEEKEALELALKKAEEIDADLILATDPDADRLGIAVRDDNNQLILLNGNQTGSLITFYMLDQLKKNNKLPKNGVVIKTIVTTDLIKAIADDYGIEVIEVLTGFKYFGEKMHIYDMEGTPEKPSKEYICGGEESYGYLIGKEVRDKDAIVASCIIAEICAYQKSKGKTIYDLLNDLYKKYGYYYEELRSLEFEGKEGHEKIVKIMKTFRNSPPKEIAGYKVKVISDITTGKGIELSTNKVVRSYDLPESNVLIFELESHIKIVARPSGTEPKIKFYFMIKETVDEDLESIKQNAKNKMNKIIESYLKMVNDIINL